VDFELSEDEVALVEAARSFLDEAEPIARARRRAAEPGAFDRELHEQAAGLGWYALERELGVGVVEQALLAAELGRSLAGLPFTQACVTLRALGAAFASGQATEEMRLGPSTLRELAEGIASGALVAAAVVVPCALPRLEIGRDGTGMTLSGRAGLAVFGPVADVALVSASLKDDGRARLSAELSDEDAGSPPGSSMPAGSEEAGLWLVWLGEQNRPQPEARMDLTRPLGWLDLDRAPAVCVGGRGALEDAIDCAATLVSAEMLGSAERVLAMATEYAGLRVQFGRPIGSFQAVKHRLADVFVDVEAMRVAVWQAGAAIDRRRDAPDEDDPGLAPEEAASVLSSVAKICCSEGSRRAMNSGLQVHGGIGFTWEHDLHLFMKRAQLDQASFGTADAHRDRLLALLRPRAERGAPVL
jgi:alkylation response protein AidB-like acyl-CoA dehydrogenase